MTPTRYFTDGEGVWKFPPQGRPQYREMEDAEWEDSAFKNLTAFLSSPGDAREITEKEGEP